jgi:uncharacterized protein (TIGR02246 family)
MSDNDTRDDLNSRLQRLEDLDEIRRIYVDYGMYLDQGDFAAFAQLFATDAKLRLGPIARGDGRDEIERVMSTRVEGRPSGSMVHVIGAPRIELDGDRATGECQWAAVVNGSDGTPVFSAVGRHLDDLVREDGRWRIERRRGFVDVPSSL